MEDCKSFFSDSNDNVTTTRVLGKLSSDCSSNIRRIIPRIGPGTSRRIVFRVSRIVRGISLASTRRTGLGIIPRIVFGIIRRIVLTIIPRIVFGISRIFLIILFVEVSLE